MKQTLSYVIVTPYSIVKSRTGGVISRLLSRLDLELVGAQMFLPDENFCREYTDVLKNEDQSSMNTEVNLLTNYITQNMGPSGGRKHRSLLLLFKGVDPCPKISAACGALFPTKETASLNLEDMHGETIRDTYADLIYSTQDPEKVVYFEPAILTPRKQGLADKNLALFAKFLKNSPNIVKNYKYHDPSKVERTLVIIKPDNWKYASSKPGAILDMFSRTDLRIVGIKVHRFSLKEALEFYGPVEKALEDKLGPIFGQKSKEILEREFQVSLSGIEKILHKNVGIECAREQFRNMIEFMSGVRPGLNPTADPKKPGSVMCMIIVYEGEDAIKKIRDVLGPTDPLKAPVGTVRREFGLNIMINTAHASDSTESYEREKNIIKVNENSLANIILEYLAETQA